MPCAIILPHSNSSAAPAACLQSLITHLLFQEESLAPFDHTRQNPLTAILSQSRHSSCGASNLHTSLLLLRLRLLRIDNALLDIAREVEEGLFDIDVRLGRDFHEGDAKFIGEGLALLDGNSALLLPVALVADEDFVDAFGGVLLDVGEPRPDVCSISLASKLLLCLLPSLIDVLLKLLSSVTSYTNKMPMAPR